jgi:hypothetical protein
MEFKGTKGKWYWSYGNSTQLASLISESGVMVCNFGDSERYYPTEGLEPNECDKKLISCAPEMLEMLEGICKLGEKAILTDQHIEAVQQLIKKATEI